MKITAEQETILKTEIETIGIFLQEKMKQDKDGYYWETIHYDQHLRQFYFKYNYSLWNGTPGIILFFLALHDYTGNTVHLDIAEKATKRALKMSYRDAATHVSLFDGISGLIYICVKLSEQLDDKVYLHHAKKLAKENSLKILEEREDDVLAGKAGCLYALTLLYHYTTEKVLLDDIRGLILNLTAAAKPRQQGISWGTGSLSMDCLCGFSHGASGIAHVLLQVGTYFNEPELIWLAEQALLYEKDYYDPTINNWLDLRWTSKNNHLPRLFEWDKETFMPTNFDVNAWAHGAAGIGLARLYAFELTGNANYLPELNAALERCVNDFTLHKKNSHLLFSGYAGLADFFIRYSQLFKNEEIFQYAVRTGLATTDYARLNGHQHWGIEEREDLGLMTGTAGIGFILLRILTNGHFDSILHPTIPSQKRPNENSLNLLGSCAIKNRFFCSYFAKTLELLIGYEISLSDIFTAGNIDEFVMLVSKKTTTLPFSEKEHARELLKLETLKTSLWREHKGSLCFQTRLTLLKADLECYKNEEISLDQKFIINPFVKIFSTQWDWSKGDMDISASGPHWNILFSSDDQIHHFTISNFPARILFHLQHPMNLYELETKISEEIVLNKAALTQILAQQVKELLDQFFIRRAEP